MPDIINIPPQRSPPRTRLRPRPLTARQRTNLRNIRRAQENDLRRLGATLNARSREYGPLAQEVELANSHRNDDAMRLRYLPHLLRNTSQRSQMEQSIQQEIDLAQANYDEGYRRYRNLDGQLINHSLLTHDLTQAHDELYEQSNDINIALGQGQIRRHRRPTYKRGKKGKRTRRRGL